MVFASRRRTGISRLPSRTVTGAVVRNRHGPAYFARTMAEGFPAIAEHEPEVLAHHYGQAGRHPLAATWFERAGDRAALRSSFVEAHAHFEASFAAAEQRRPTKSPARPSR